MSDEAFNELVEAAIAKLPGWVQKEMVNVSFVVLDVPTALQREMNDLTDDDILFGLYEGVPLSERGNDPVLMPDQITLFKKAILESYERKEDIQACIENTVWHEVAHYLGHDEEWVAEEEVKRGKVL